MKKRFVTTYPAVVWLFLATAFALGQVAPPTEKNKREADLLELIKLDRTIKLDIRYARADNFVGRAVYGEARAFLQRPAAEALLRVNFKLRERNFGLIIFDGYRPWSVTKLFWEVTPEEKRSFVADPKTGSRHNRGCAVDLSIYDLTTGKSVAMPSDFDDFSERASPNYKGGTKEERANRDLLRETMESEGFTVYKNEWWHFDYKDWPEYAIYDIAFSEIRNFDLIKDHRVRRVEFSGDLRHSLREFRRAIFLTEGELFRLENLLKTIREINELGIFETIDESDIAWNASDKEKDVDFIFYVNAKKAKPAKR